MNTINQTDEFSDWLERLRDAIGKAAILTRITRAGHGNFGECEPVGADIKAAKAMWKQIQKERR